MWELVCGLNGGSAVQPAPEWGLDEGRIVAVRIDYV